MIKIFLSGQYLLKGVLSMRNKKILNICLLTFALITLITFILPIKKFGLGENDAGFVRVMFYLLNAIMIMAVVALIVMSFLWLIRILIL